MKMKYDESDNAVIRASRAVTERVTDLLGNRLPELMFMWFLLPLLSETMIDDIMHGRGSYREHGNQKQSCSINWLERCNANRDAETLT